MPALPRPFIRRAAAPPAVNRSAEQPPLPRQRPVPPADGRTDARPAPSPSAPRKTWVDRLFPVQPGMKEPSWSRVIGLIIFMALVWELFSYFYTYFLGINVFGGRMPSHNQVVAWRATLETLPWALALSALGSVPGFWLMRARVRRANAIVAKEQAARRAVANPNAGQGRSSRARRRREARRSGKR